MFNCNYFVNVSCDKIDYKNRNFKPFHKFLEKGAFLTLNVITVCLKNLKKTLLKRENIRNISSHI